MSEYFDPVLHTQARGSVGQRRAQLKDMAFRGAKSKQRYKHRSIVTEASSPEKSPTKKKAKQGGGKGGLSVQWAVRSAAETVTDGPDTDPPDSLLHMPQLQEDTEAKGSKAGRKRKADANMEICDAPSKQKKTSTEDEQESASETASAAEATKSPKKRGRGRPPKAEGVARKKVGRPRKQPQTDAHKEGEEATEGVNFKAPKLRVVPLKIKDSSKKKKKQ
ncbi:hypothetical protein V1264_013148 [Littorina saxatilis]|uniref:Uncharacterized protein n=1 Tax=Littorina saxatilis TaxID=31220 RepID=A0AAN9BMJ3_9CAEN